MCALGSNRSFIIRGWVLNCTLFDEFYERFQFVFTWISQMSKVKSHIFSHFVKFSHVWVCRLFISTLHSLFPSSVLEGSVQTTPPPISPSSILVPPVLIGFPATSFHVDAPQPHWCFMLNSGSVQLFLRPPRLMTAFHFYAKTKRCLFTAIVHFRPLIPAPPPPPTTRQLPLKWLLFTLQAFSLPVCGQSYSWH